MRSILFTGDLQIGLLRMTRPVPRAAVTADGTLWAPTDELAGSCGRYLRDGTPSPLLDVWGWDVVDVPQGDRLRALLHLRGTVRMLDCDEAQILSERWQLDVAAFTPETVVLAGYEAGSGFTEKQAVPLPAYRAAAPSRLAEWEGPWLRHLAAHHGPALCDLARHQVPVRGRDVVKPLAVDEAGLALRVYRSRSTQDVRVPFPDPVRCRCQAVAAVRGLLTGFSPAAAPADERSDGPRGPDAADRTPGQED